MGKMREELIAELDKVCGGRVYPQEVVNYILTDRKRIDEAAETFKLIVKRQKGLTKEGMVLLAQQALKNMGRRL